MKTVVIRNWPAQCFHPHQWDNYLLQQVGAFSKLLLSVGELKYTLIRCALFVSRNSGGGGGSPGWRGG